MIPLGDNLPTLRRPWMTWVLLGVTFAVWIFLEGAGTSPVLLIMRTCNWGLVPAELTHLRPVGYSIPMGGGYGCAIDNSSLNFWTPLLSIFLHGGWAHILGNSLYLWVFGNNVEDSMGHYRFLVFYLVCGLAAGCTHILMNPASPIPTVGASGAISGVLGAYLVLYPRARIRSFWFIFIIAVPAWLMLIVWFAEQAFSGLSQLSPMRPDASSGVAVWAHVGGFLAGLILVNIFKNREYVAAHRAMLAQRQGVWSGS